MTSSCSQLNCHLLFQVNWKNFLRQSFSQFSSVDIWKLIGADSFARINLTFQFDSFLVFALLALEYWEWTCYCSWRHYWLSRTPLILVSCLKVMAVDRCRRHRRARKCYRKHSATRTREGFDHDVFRTVPTMSFSASKIFVGVRNRVDNMCTEQLRIKERLPAHVSWHPTDLTHFILVTLSFPSYKLRCPISPPNSSSYHTVLKFQPMSLYS